MVLGFPLLTSLALTSAPASHGAVVIAVLPAATAVAAVVRTRERPGRGFWIAAVVGAVVAVAFALAGGSGGLHVSDLLLLGAVAAAAVGYAEGGVLSRELGAWQTISWALVLSSPVMVGLTAFSALRTPVTADPVAWGSFATWPSSACSSASSPGIADSPSGRWPASASCSSLNRCSHSRGRLCCSGSS